MPRCSNLDTSPKKKPRARRGQSSPLEMGHRYGSDAPHEMLSRASSLVYGRSQLSTEALQDAVTQPNLIAPPRLGCRNAAAVRTHHKRADL